MPLEILSISGPSSVDCGVGPRTFTAQTNGEVVNDWRWTSPPRTESPINGGPSLTINFVNSQPGVIQISVSANDGTASASKSITINPHPNCEVP